MRKILISAAAAASALAFASPAAAQYWPQQQGYGNQGYGYQDNYGRVHALDARIDQLRHQIRQFHAQGRLNRRDAAILDRQAMVMKRNLHYVAQDRFTARESRQFEHGIERLRYTVRREVRSGPGHRYSRYGY